MKQLYILPFVLSGLFVAAQVETDSIGQVQPLGEIVISSLHVSDSLMRTPAAVFVLQVKQLQRGNATDVAAVVNRVSGVLMQSGSLNTNRISIRGIGARTPFGTNRIRAFYGSIPLTSGDGETTIEDLNLENLSQAEIIKGPLSSVYGAGLGGAILLSPVKPENGISANASSVYGWFGLRKFNAGVSLGDESSSANVNFHTLDSDGWRQNSSYHREAATVSGELFRTAKSKFSYLGNYTYLKAYIPSSINRETFENNPRAAAPTWLESKGFEQYKSLLSGLEYDFSLGRFRGKSSVFVNAKDANEPRPFDILKQNTFGYGGRAQFSGKLGEINFVVSGEFFSDRFKARTFENLYQENDGNGSLPGEKLSEARQRRSFYNAFAQLRTPIVKTLELQAGLNVNQTRFSLDNAFPAENRSWEKYRYDAIWSPHVSLLFVPNERLTIYASASRGFSLPSVEETLTAAGTVNRDIRPESGTNLEIGAKSFFLNRHVYAELSLYSMNVLDLLVARRVGDDQYVGVNAGRTLHRGIESFGKYRSMIADLTLDLYVSASLGQYVFRDFNDGGNDFSGNRLPGVPQAKAGSGFTLATKTGLYVSADFLYVGKMPLDDANSGYNDAYRLLDLEAGWKLDLTKDFSVRISAGINNALDEHYASMILVNATASGNSAPRYYYPGLPANVYGSFSVRHTF